MVVMGRFKARIGIGCRTEATDLACNEFFENRVFVACSFVNNKLTE